MKRKLFAICDQDERYLQGMQEFLSKTEYAEYTAEVYTRLDQAIADSRQTPFEIALINENLYDASLEEMQARQIYILREGTDGPALPYPMLMKYQPVTRLLQEIRTAQSQTIQSPIYDTKLEQAQLLTFYSPQRQDLCMQYSYAHAVQLGREGQKVLYVNLLAFSGFEEIFGVHYDADITDYLYFAVRQPDKAAARFDSIRQSREQIDYLPPALDYVDLQMPNSREWEQVTHALCSLYGYDIVVIALSEVCQDFYGILQRSDKVYVVTQENAQGNAMRQQFLAMLRIRAAELAQQQTRVECLNVP